MTRKPTKKRARSQGRKSAVVIPVIERIDTYREFKQKIVAADFDDFMNAKGDLRKAWHCAGSLFHLHEWVYAAHKSSIDAKYQFVDDQSRTQSVSCAMHFANSLGQRYPDFQIIRGIANSSKHFILKTPPSGRANPPGMPSHAANTYVSLESFNPGFDPGGVEVFTRRVRLQNGGSDKEFAILAQSALDMWDELFRREKW